MTNAEAAAHFASLPPDKDAEITVINGDTCTMNTYDLRPTDEDDLEEIDADAEDKGAALKLLHIWLEW